MGISSRDDWRCWSIRRSVFDESAIHSWSLESIKLMKRGLKRRMLDELSVMFCPYSFVSQTYLFLFSRLLILPMSSAR